MRKKIKIEEIPGIGPKLAEKLKEVGILDPMVLAVSSPSELSKILDIGEGVALKIIRAAREALNIGFESADKIYERKI